MKRNTRIFDGKEYDLVILGGGVSGAAVAWDAALRGLKVALVDKGDFGGGTSTATSKLIHGGLRYLKNFELALVRESLRERRTLEKIAPHLVYPLPFVVPVYGWLMFLMLFVGMLLYELLSFDKALLKDKTKRLKHFSVFSKRRLLAADPDLHAAGLVGGYQYYDCQSLNPERLTLAFIKSAVAAGADVANYVRGDSLILEGKRVRGIVAKDMFSKEPVEIRGKTVVVAAGPWADIALAKAMGRKPHTKIRRSKGIHVVTRGERPPFALTLAGKGGGHFFIIPWRGHTLIGTTDTEFVGEPEACEVTPKDIADFMDNINRSYGLEHKLRPEDVVFGYAGLRPLVDRQTKGTYDVSRKHEIVDHVEDGVEGLFSVLGGKYTTSRELAELMVDTVLQRLGRSAACLTQETRLAGGEIDDMAAFIDKARAELSPLGSAAEMVARQFGTDYPKVLEVSRENPAWQKPIAAGDSVIAEAVYAIREEMAVTLGDILFRRTGIATLGNPGDDVIVAVAAIAKAELGWDEERAAAEIEQVKQRLDFPRRLFGQAA